MLRMLFTRMCFMLIVFSALLPTAAQDSLSALSPDTLSVLRPWQRYDFSLSAPHTTMVATSEAEVMNHPLESRIRPQQIIVPTAMIAMGAVAIGMPRLCDWKMDVRNAFQRGRGTHRKANVETWATLASQLVVFSIGPKPKNSFVDRMLAKATGYTILYTTMPVVKRCVHEPRPDGHGGHSFPSFKTANAFMVAEQTRIERGWAWGMGMYAFATGVGVMQMYNDRCYINDVLAGAGMGILAIHAAYWILPYERRWFRLDKKKQKSDGSGMVVIPTYDYSSKTVGISLAAQL